MVDVVDVVVVDSSSSSPPPPRPFSAAAQVTDASWSHTSPLAIRCLAAFTEMLIRTHLVALPVRWQSTTLPVVGSAAAGAEAAVPPAAVLETAVGTASCFLCPCRCPCRAAAWPPRARPRDRRRRAGEHETATFPSLASVADAVYDTFAPRGPVAFVTMPAGAVMTGSSGRRRRRRRPRSATRKRGARPSGSSHRRSRRRGRRSPAASCPEACRSRAGGRDPSPAAEWSSPATRHTARRRAPCRRPSAPGRRERAAVDAGRPRGERDRLAERACPVAAPFRTAKTYRPSWSGELTLL